MNKNELKQLWGKYCDTDKLIMDMSVLLTKHRHRSTEHGICTMLHEYFTNKEPLIRLFMTSPNYIGDMRIVTQENLIRTLDRYAIQNFCNSFVQRVECEKIIYKNHDNEGKTLPDYIKTGHKVFDAKSFANNNKTYKARIENFNKFDLNNGLTRESINEYNYFRNEVYAFRDIHTSTLDADKEFHHCIIKKGTKTSRAFGKICTSYGIDKAPSYNKLFAQYADMVAEGSRKLYFVISLNPLDYLTMSVGESWTSCHHLTTGGYKAGCESYMLDSTSIITFVINDISAPIHEHGKIYREMFHCKDQTILQSRIYPQGNDGSTDLYAQFRGIVQKQFAIMFGTSPDNWNIRTGSSWCNTYVTSYGRHYRDYNYHSTTAMFLPTGKDISHMNIGHDTICPVCGRTHTNLSSSVLVCCR